MGCQFALDVRDPSGMSFGEGFSVRRQDFESESQFCRVNGFQLTDIIAVFVMAVEQNEIRVAIPLVVDLTVVGSASEFTSITGCRNHEGILHHRPLSHMEPILLIAGLCGSQQLGKAVQSTE